MLVTNFCIKFFKNILLYTNSGLAKIRSVHTYFYTLDVSFWLQLYRMVCPNGNNVVCKRSVHDLGQRPKQGGVNIHYLSTNIGYFQSRQVYYASKGTENFGPQFVSSTRVLIFKEILFKGLQKHFLVGSFVFLPILKKNKHHYKTFTFSCVHFVLNLDLLLVQQNSCMISNPPSPFLH